MLRVVTAEAGSRGAHRSMRARLNDVVKRLWADPTASTAIEYGLTLAGLALSVSGVGAAIGVDIAAIFDQIQVEFCKQLYSVCVAR